MYVDIKPSAHTLVQFSFLIRKKTNNPGGSFQWVVSLKNIIAEPAISGSI